MNSTFQKSKQAYLEDFEKNLDKFIPEESTMASELYESIIYTLKNGGKRLRPLLVRGAFNLFPNEEDPSALMAGVECYHISSLIYDDLPCMDNSDFRHNQPACHKKFSESTAIVTAISLNLLVPQIIAKHYGHIPEFAIWAYSDTSLSAGHKGIASGQIKDLQAEGQRISIEALQEIHLLKTAKLFQGCLTGGYKLTSNNKDDSKIETLEEAGKELGLAFQIVDDILDVTSTEKVLGKPIGIDGRNKKTTYPSLFGIEESRKQAKEHTDNYIQLIQSFGSKNTFLIDLSKEMLERIY